MAAADNRLHWIMAAAVLVADVCLVAATLVLDGTSHVVPPAPGLTDKSAAIAWLSVVSSAVVFGCYGVLIKTPSVQAANCDCMVFQCYVSLAVALVSLLIWVLGESRNGFHLTGSSFAMGLLFGAMWIVSQGFGFVAINTIGYAVAPAIWIGTTIVVSFAWGLVFGTQVNSWPLAMAAIVCLLLGVGLTAYSSIASMQPCDHSDEREQPLASDSAPRQSFLTGALAAMMLGVCNGSLMVSMRCFADGCDAIGVHGYEGDSLPSLAFLPSLALGVLAAQPCVFVLYWGRRLCQGERPNFHLKAVALPAALTGCYWGMGNFTSMFATVYLGQTIGFPLTQCSLIVSGLWGVLYYQEIHGSKALKSFVGCAGILLLGAALLGLS